MADLSKYPEGFDAMMNGLKFPNDDPEAKKAYLMSLLDRLIRQ